MTVDDVYEIINYAINKNQNGTLKAEDFNRIVPLAESGYINYLLGTFQTYQVGRPISKVELGQNSVVRQRLSPLIMNVILNIDADGICSYPNNYIQADALWVHDSNYKRVRWCDQDRWYSKVNSIITPVSSNPIYMITDFGFKFEPKNINKVDLSYVRRPATIKWDFVLDSNGRRIYNAGTSVQPVWNDISMLEIIVRALALVGINLQLRDVENYSQIIKTQGQ